jgi:hypothetical protein
MIDLNGKTAQDINEHLRFNQVIICGPKYFKEHGRDHPVHIATGIPKSRYGTCPM